MALFNKSKAKQALIKKAAREKEKLYNILLIDDEVDNLNVLAELLKDEYNIFVAESGAKGLEIIQNKHIDLIITDQRMPEMTGVQMLKKTVDDHPDTIRMILTGFTDVNAIIDAINSGQVYRYITKPWNEGELRITIKQGLEKYELSNKVKRLIDELTQKNEELTQLNLSLEKKVEERTREVIDAHEQIANMHKEMLYRFMSPLVADKLLASGGDAAQLTSTRKNLTVFFSDMRGFTSLTDSIEPEELCGILNEYFTEMTKIIYKYEGTLDKFMGDGIMVFFNDPLEQKDHAKRAILMALEMQDRMKELETHWYDKGVETPLGIGIGIATGYVTVGNFGSDQRMDYTIIGSHVNLSSRLQHEAEGGEIVVSHRTFVQVKDVIEYEELGEITVKGIHNPVKIYRITGIKE